MDSLKLSFAALPDLHRSRDNQKNEPIVLLVEDHEDSLLLLSCILEPLNYKLMTASDGKTALSITQRYLPDLILLDILLPYMDGLEVISQLRQSPKTRDIPIIAITALAKEEDKHSIIQAGANAYICKPYLLSELETTIQPFLSHLQKTSSV